MRNHLLVLALLAAASSALAQSPPKAPPAVNGCIECHTALDDPRITPPVKLFADDVHAKAGFTCVFCHGGNAAAEDQDGAVRQEHCRVIEPRRAHEARATPPPHRSGPTSKYFPMAYEARNTSHLYGA